MNTQVLAGKVLALKQAASAFVKGATTKEFKSIIDIEPAKKALLEFGILEEVGFKPGKGRKAVLYKVNIFAKDFANKVEMAFNKTKPSTTRMVTTPKAEITQPVIKAEKKVQSVTKPKADKCAFPSMEDALVCLKRYCPKGVKLTIEIVGE